MENIKVAIIDYGMGNLFSVLHACEFIGLNCIITSNKYEILNSDAAILPGVGAFGDAMENLKKLDLIFPIYDFIKSNKPFLGICLGMQLFMKESEEFGIHKGLGIFNGYVKKFTNISNKNFKVPQVGWNKIYPLNPNVWHLPNSPMKNINYNEHMYFVHSYCCILDDKNIICSLTNYEDVEYSSSVLKDNVFLCQFHPEKSGKVGLKIYEEWAKIIQKNKNLEV